MFTTCTAPRVAGLPAHPVDGLAGRLVNPVDHFSVETADQCSRLRQDGLSGRSTAHCGALASGSGSEAGGQSLGVTQSALGGCRCRPAPT